MSITVKIKRIHPDAMIPKYATAGAGAFDLHALIEKPCVEGAKSYERVCRGTPITFRTGLSFEIPDGYVMFVFSRSGHGFNFDMRLSNCVGVIDSDYRGEVKVKLTCDGDNELVVNHGDRIAQAIVLPYPRVVFEESNLSSTERGICGFGSTGS